MDPDSILETVNNGTKFGEKVIGIIEKLFGPRLTRRQADADTYADEKRLQTIRSNPDMEIVYIDGKLNARLQTPDALAYRANERIFSESIRQEKNLEKILENAVDEAFSSQDVSEQEVDEDWLTRFFGFAKDISSQEMQIIWGKILAGEVIQPGSFSLRTLDTLRNLSRTNAEQFQKILPAITGNLSSQFISSDHDKYSLCGLSFDEIMELAECGLLSSHDNVEVIFPLKKGSTNEFVSKHHIILIKELQDQETKIHFGVYSLTRAGRELSGILDCADNEEYLKAFAKSIYQENQSHVVVSLHKLIQRRGGEIEYETTPLATFGEEIKEEN